MASITYSKDGHATSFVGEEATNFFRLNTLIQGLKLEKVGIRVIRGSCLKIAKQTTGLRTNDRDEQIRALRAMAELLLMQCEQIHEE